MGDAGHALQSREHTGLEEVNAKPGMGSAGMQCKGLQSLAGLCQPSCMDPGSRVGHLNQEAFGTQNISNSSIHIARVPASSSFFDQGSHPGGMLCSIQ